MRRGLRIALAVTAIAGLAALGWAVLVEPRMLAVRQGEVAAPQWPAGHAPLRAALVADLHVGSLWNGTENLARVVAAVNAQAPDIVLLLGDFVTTGTLAGPFVAPDAIADVLAGLDAKLGVYAVLGNHDWDFDGPRVRRALEGAGIAVLEDEVALVTRPGGDFALAGVPDDTTRDPDVAATLSKVPAGARDGLPVIVVTHDPAVFADVPDSRVAATFAGHTHGGQVRLPLIGSPVTPGRAPSRWAFGHVVEGGRHLYVSGGVGTSILPLRFNMPPGVEIVTVRARTQ